MNVNEITKSKGEDVITISPAGSFVSAAHLMRRNNIGFLVVAGGASEILGVLSERDIVGAVAEQSNSIPDMSVEDVYIRDPITCSPKDDPLEVLKLMNTQGFRHMPIVDSGKLCGIISNRDIFKFLGRKSDVV